MEISFFNSQDIFLPLFEVTMDPNSHPELNEFLKEVVAFDSCDDESTFEESPIHKHPKDWTSTNPDYAYYMYFTYANMYSLNQLRQSRGLSTFAFRPHAGEAGSKYHLADCFLLANSVNHGIQLKLSPSLQYLYYLEEVGLSVSPLSNNVLFMNYHENPFYDFFKRGLNVTLSTDDPLQFHSTEQPLIEEYSAAAQIWKLTVVDMSEIAKNSVLQSGFSLETKKKWLGENFEKRGAMGNHVDKSNIPEIRVIYREEVFQNEWKMLEHFASQK
jgi:AMP deaminase